MERRRAGIHELVIPISIGHLCGAPSARRSRKCRWHGIDLEARRCRAVSRHGYSCRGQPAEGARRSPIVSMAVGQPSDPAPRGCGRPQPGRWPTAGSAIPTRLALPALRQAIAAHYARHYGVDVPPARIAVTTGSSAAFNLAFLAMFDPGDRGRHRLARISGLSQHHGGARAGRRRDRAGGQAAFSSAAHLARPRMRRSR